jgi:hypothetical protein
MNIDRTTFLSLVMAAGFGNAVGCGSSEPSQPPAAEAAPETTSGAEQPTPPPAETPSTTAPAAPVDPVVEQSGPAYE